MRNARISRYGRSKIDSHPGLRSGPLAKDRVIQNQQYHRADERDQDAVDVHAGYARLAERIEDPSADQSADDSEKDIAHESFAGAIDDLAGEKSRDQTHENPRNKAHSCNSSRFGRNSIELTSKKSESASRCVSLPNLNALSMFAARGRVWRDAERGIEEELQWPI